ncbi:5-keto-4-deoxy-D-glucarate aldolase [Gimesia alba]|uniref:5-keto-4-deoxy-D-glucarate aldolase n=1 Tax=Gimesia alba TaxID=2527973 RepID=A0A517RKG7_9PLAN|nr:aldolase/citrate lyase family protein [Gimesia alba]QDT44371.1 5-keto-4-deoxy-D-glucarate aldolase [Gimesia alba]
MFVNKIKTLLSQGEVALGVGMPDASEILAKLSVDTGIDFLWIDLEHRPYSVNEVKHLPEIARRKGCMPMIRVPGLDPIYFKKALDIGANTIMVPQINNAEEAKLAVQYAKYPPEGTRGVSPDWTMFMDFSFDDYLPHANEETAIVAQIESPEGIENIEEIAAVDGIDVVFAGPMDLSASLGIIGQTQHPELLKLLADFPKRVARANKPAGITFADLDRCRQAIDEGYRFVNIGSVASLGTFGIKAVLPELRERARK